MENTHFDFSETLWRRVSVDTEHLDFLKRAIESGEVQNYESFSAYLEKHEIPVVIDSFVDSQSKGRFTDDCTVEIVDEKGLLLYSNTKEF